MDDTGDPVKQRLAIKLALTRYERWELFRHMGFHPDMILQTMRLDRPPTEEDHREELKLREAKAGKSLGFTNRYQEAKPTQLRVLQRREIFRQTSMPGERPLAPLEYELQLEDALDLVCYRAFQMNRDITGPKTRGLLLPALKQLWDDANAQQYAPFSEHGLH